MTTTAHSLLSCFLPSKAGQRVYTLFGPSYSKNSPSKRPRTPNPSANPRISAPWTGPFVTPALNLPICRLARSCPGPWGAPARRGSRIRTGCTPDVQGMYNGCTPDAHRSCRCAPGVHPLYIPCTPLVHGQGVALARLWAGAATFPFRQNASRTVGSHSTGAVHRVCRRFPERGCTRPELSCCANATSDWARIHSCSGCS
jgi:hypothetical protein